MRRDDFVRDILHNGDPGVGASLVRGLLTPLAGLHRVGLEAYLLPYHTGLRKRYCLRRPDGSPVPTVSIGNLSSGGTGKTPLAALVAAHLKERGKRVILLSRGHGATGEASHNPRIVSDGSRVLLAPAEAGDEPVLLADLLPGVPVIVGRDRRKSGRLALERFAPDVVVLDDALQYWQLHRDLDIVLLDARRPFDNGYVLPRGLLREPPAHLSRAGIVVLTRADRADPAHLSETITRVERLAPKALVLTATHKPTGWLPSGDSTIRPLDLLRGGDVIAFSGIADHHAFAASLAPLGVHISENHDFGDHHAYTRADAARLASCGLPAVTTEKDLVKIGPLWPADGPPLYALRIEMILSDPARFLERLDAVADGTPSP